MHCESRSTCLCIERIQVDMADCFVKWLLHGAPLCDPTTADTAPKPLRPQTRPDSADQGVRSHSTVDQVVQVGC